MLMYQFAFKYSVITYIICCVCYSKSHHSAELPDNVLYSICTLVCVKFRLSTMNVLLGYDMPVELDEVGVISALPELPVGSSVTKAAIRFHNYPAVFNIRMFIR